MQANLIKILTANQQGEFLSRSTNSNALYPPSAIDWSEKVDDREKSLAKKYIYKKNYL